MKVLGLTNQHTRPHFSQFRCTTLQTISVNYCINNIGCVLRDVCFKPAAYHQRIYLVCCSDKWHELQSKQLWKCFVYILKSDNWLLFPCRKKLWLKIDVSTPFPHHCDLTTSDPVFFFNNVHEFCYQCLCPSIQLWSSYMEYSRRRKTVVDFDL